MSNDKKYPLTVMGLYATKTPGNSRSQILTQEYADKACAAIQAAVGGKLAVKATNPQTKAAKGDKFPDYFLEAVTADLLAEERARMESQSPNRANNARAAQTLSAGDDAL